MARMTILAPMTGTIVPIDDMPDPVFSERMLGDEIALELPYPAGGGRRPVRTPPRSCSRCPSRRGHEVPGERHEHERTEGQVDKEPAPGRHRPLRACPPGDEPDERPQEDRRDALGIHV